MNLLWNSLMQMEVLHTFREPCNRKQRYIRVGSRSFCACVELWMSLSLYTFQGGTFFVLLSLFFLSSPYFPPPVSQLFHAFLSLLSILLLLFLPPKKEEETFCSSFWVLMGKMEKGAREWEGKNFFSFIYDTFFSSVFFFFFRFFSALGSFFCIH